MTRADDSDAERDAYLRSALRHAPDASLAPPDALDDAILRRARSATAETDADLKPHVPLPRDQRSLASGSGVDRIVRGLAGAWSWLARPPVASTFAGVMVATLVGVMWWGRPLDESMPGRFEPPASPAPVASALDPGAVAMRSEPPKAEAKSSPVETSGSAADVAKLRQEAPAIAAQRPSPDALTRSTPEAFRENAEPASPPPTSKAAPEALAKRKAAQAESSDLSDARIDGRARERQGSLDSGPAALAVPKARSTGPASEPSVTPSPLSEPPAPNRFQLALPRQDASSVPLQATPALGAAASTVRETPTSSAASGPAAKPAARDAPDRLAAAPARSAIIAAAPPPRPMADRDAASSDAAGAADARTTEQTGAAEVRRAERPDAAPPSTGALSSGRVTAPTRSPLMPLRAALVTEADRWTWSGDGRRVQRVTPALLSWLARLDVALAAQSTDIRLPEPAPESDDPAPAASAPTGPLHTLVLLREGRRHTELRLGEALEVTPIDPPGPRWRAALSAADAATLRESLP